MPLKIEIYFSINRLPKVRLPASNSSTPKKQPYSRYCRSFPAHIVEPIALYASYLTETTNNKATSTQRKYPTPGIAQSRLQSGNQLCAALGTVEWVVVAPRVDEKPEIVTEQPHDGIVDTVTAVVETRFFIALRSTEGNIRWRVMDNVIT